MMKTFGRGFVGWILAVTSVAVSAGCAVHFVPGEARPLVDAAGNLLPCDGQVKAVFAYTKDKRDGAIYIDIRNSGTCPMDAKIVVGDKAEKTLRIARDSRSFIRFDTGKNFQVEVTCQQTDNPANCAGTVALTPVRNGGGAQSELVLREGDAVPAPTDAFTMKCDSPARPLPVTLENASKKKLDIVFEAENTSPVGSCPNFSLLVSDGARMSEVMDGLGGTSTVEQGTLGNGKTLTFSIKCSGTGSTSQVCDGNVRVKVLD